MAIMNGLRHVRRGSILWRSQRLLGGDRGLETGKLKLALARVVDRLGQDSRRLLRGMETKGVFRGDEVKPPLRLALQITRGLELRIARPGFRRCLNRGDEVDHRALAACQQRLRAVLDRLRPPKDLLLAVAVADLARLRDVQQRAANMMRAHLDRADALI